MNLLIQNSKRLGWIVLVVLIGTLFDYLVHASNETFAVPDYYFRHKLIYAVVWIAVGTAVFWKVRPLLWKAVLVTGFFAIILQTRYFFAGYPIWFVLLFMGVHGITFGVPLYLVFRHERRLFGVR